jgi:uncharacterized protein
MSSINFEALWERATADFALGEVSLHGPDHWRRVERNGLALAERNGANVEIVRLFAVLHDSQRRNESHDPQHGARAADYAAQLHGEYFVLPNEELELLQYALTHHAKGMLSNDVTIGTCWDADRLDLGRVGIAPSAAYLSTAAAKQLLRGRR